MGPKYNDVATSLEEFSCTKTIGGANTNVFQKGPKSKSGPDSQFGASSDCEGEGKASIPSMYAQRLLMGPKYNDAKSFEET